MAERELRRSCDLNGNIAGRGRRYGVPRSRGGTILTREGVEHFEVVALSTTRRLKPGLRTFIASRLVLVVR